MDEVRISSPGSAEIARARNGTPLRSESIRILYLGVEDGTSLDRANAYRRLRHSVDHIDVRRLLPSSGMVDLITWRAGGQVFAPLVRARLSALLRGRSYDLCHVDAGEWVTPRVIRLLREHAPQVINYNVDDPLGPRDLRRFSSYRQSIPHYDHLFVVRAPNVDEARRLGAKAVHQVWRSADEITHAPRALSEEDHRRWDCDVMFLGTWMPERGPLLLRLVELGVPLTIRGDRWNRAPEWQRLQAYWKGASVWGDDYAKAIQCARINLGLTSKGNRDLHTTRSLEIPALGALLCAERTEDHSSMYIDGEEAVLWSTPEECALACDRLLVDAARRERIAARGRARLLRNGHLNEPVMRQLLDAAGLASD